MRLTAGRVSAYKEDTVPPALLREGSDASCFARLLRSGSACPAEEHAGLSDLLQERSDPPPVYLRCPPSRLQRYRLHQTGGRKAGVSPARQKIAEQSN